MELTTKEIYNKIVKQVNNNRVRVWRKGKIYPIKMKVLKISHVFLRITILIGKNH